MSPLAAVGISIVLLIIFLMLSIPLPYCFGGALAFLVMTAGVSMKSMMLYAFAQTTGSVLLASPMFILAGNYMGGSGIATKLLDFADAFIGHIKGGLGIVSVVTCAVIGAISGSGFTGVAATGPIMIPRMEEQGYPRGFATALTTVSSVLGLLIPPSAIMVVYGWVTETSILACFLSTVIPGLLVTFLFCLINMLECKKFDLIVAKPLHGKAKLNMIFTRFVKAIPALVMPVIILGGMGLKYDDYLYFKNVLDDHGALSRSVLFVHTAADPVVECLLVPDMCLAVAEKYALEKKRVLVLLTDMTNFADAMKEIAITME